MTLYLPHSRERIVSYADPQFHTFNNRHTYLFKPWSMTVSRQLVNLNSSSIYVGARYMAPKTGSISHVGWTSSFQSPAAPPTYKAQIETTAGALWAGGTTANFNVGGVLNTFTWTALGTNASVTQGDFFHAVIRYSTGTVDGTHRNVFAAGAYYVGSSTETGGPNQFPYCFSNTKTYQIMPCIGVKYSDGEIVQGGVLRHDSSSSLQWAGNSTPDEYGVKWTQPYDAVLWAYLIRLGWTSNLF